MSRVDRDAAILAQGTGNQMKKHDNQQLTNRISQRHGVVLERHTGKVSHKVGRMVSGVRRAG